ncbi:MAG: MFS transporter, partial [Microbacterium sp.]|nr:MFS transporter [Microbacterium sp.]
TLTPQLVHAADPATQAAVAAIYRDVFTPIFLALAAVYAIGIVAALLLPRGRLSDDHEPAPATEPIAA